MMRGVEKSTPFLFFAENNPPREKKSTVSHKRQSYFIVFNGYRHYVGANHGWRLVYFLNGNTGGKPSF